jgi:hypothetical protein
MRLRDPSDGALFHIKFSELFEAAFTEIAERYPLIHDVFDNVEWSLERTPEADTEACPAFPDRNFRLLVTPRTPHYPALRILLEVADRHVHCWAVSEKGQGD